MSSTKYQPEMIKKMQKQYTSKDQGLDEAMGMEADPMREPTLAEMVAEIEKMSYAIASSLGLDLPVTDTTEKVSAQTLRRMHHTVSMLVSARAVLGEVGNEINRINQALG